MTKQNLVLEMRSIEVFQHYDGRIFNITDLRKWLEASGHEAKASAVPFWNVEGMIEAHEWDSNRTERVQSLIKRIEKERAIPVLICATPEEQKDGMTVDFIDGWHTLYFLYRMARIRKSKLVTFPAYWIRHIDLKPFEIPKERTRNWQDPPAGVRPENKRIIKI